MRHWLAAWAWLPMLLLPLTAVAQPWQPPDNIAKAFLVAVDGKTIWAAHEHELLPPASLTKLMTALLIAHLQRTDEWVTVSKAAAKQRPTKLGLRAGEQLQVGDLTAALLIHSANDACLALAEWAAGSEEKFVALMNANAAALGLSDTHFSNACGFDTPMHHSSAADLSVLAQAVMQQPALMRWTALQEYKITTRKGRNYKFKTSNALLGRFSGAIGLKTGYTQKAGPCLIALAERDGRLVMLNAKNRWWLADEILEHAFAHH